MWGKRDIHEIFHIVSRFLRYISWYIAENWLPSGQCMYITLREKNSFSKLPFTEFLYGAVILVLVFWAKVGSINDDIGVPFLLDSGLFCPYVLSFYLNGRRWSPSPRCPCQNLNGPQQSGGPSCPTSSAVWIFFNSV